MKVLINRQNPAIRIFAPAVQTERYENNGLFIEYHIESSFASNHFCELEWELRDAEETSLQVASDYINNHYMQIDGHKGVFRITDVQPVDMKELRNICESAYRAGVAGKLKIEFDYGRI